MTSEKFEAVLTDVERRAQGSVKSKVAEIKEKYEELLKIANSASVVTMETRHRAARLYSELSGFAEALLISDNISYYDYIQIMADLGAILAAVM